MTVIRKNSRPAKEGFGLDAQETAILRDCIEDLSRNGSFVNMRHYIQHGQTDCLLHSIAVAYFSYAAAMRLNLSLNKKCLIRGALLHDFFLYDWHESNAGHRLHGFTHPGTALENALRGWELGDIEKDIISKHMFPLVPALPRFKESILVCIADKICSAAEILRLPPSAKVRDLYDRALKNNVT